MWCVCVFVCVCMCGVGVCVVCVGVVCVWGCVGVCVCMCGVGVCGVCVCVGVVCVARPVEVCNWNFFFANLSDRMERPLQYERRRSAVVFPVVKYAGHICFEVKITCSIK